jgi:hypothetical protein
MSFKIHALDDDPFGALSVTFSLPVDVMFLVLSDVELGREGLPADMPKFW